MTDPIHEGDSEAQIRRTALYSTLAQVPAGKVVSYGQLADLAGLGRAARWVGRTLSQLPGDTKLPWHRVLGAGGRISLPVGSPSGDEQRARLRMEGITVLNNRVDFNAMARVRQSTAVRVRACPAILRQTSALPVKLRAALAAYARPSSSAVCWFRPSAVSWCSQAVVWRVKPAAVNHRHAA